MKKFRKTLCLAMALIFVAASPATAAVRANTAFCNNVSCHALMNSLGKYAKCKYCSKTADGYICPNCGQAWAVCPSGHYQALHPVG